jgi:hypothetical protein
MFTPHDYIISSGLFLQLLGLIFFFAFGAFLFQIRGLIGEKGILPITSYLALITRFFGKRRVYAIPSIFWIKSTDWMLLAVTAVGTVLSILLLFNVFPWIVLPLLFILYLSIVTVGQEFLSFGWESFLLEITFNAIFLSMTTVPNPWIWISLYLLLFRFHFQGGIVKLLSGDANWRNLTAVGFHYQSQPIPNTIAWYAHKLPIWFQKSSTAFMFFVELIVPFGIFFSSQEINLFVFVCFIGLQFLIWFTGNFSFLNHLTAIFSIILVSDFYFEHIGMAAPVAAAPNPLYLDIFLTVVGALLVFLQIISMWNSLFKPNPIYKCILSWLQPFHLINRYGIFAVMTTKRYEIVIEGSDDGVNWKEYLFYYKPSEVSRRPRRISPYQPRLDWQVWFLPFNPYEPEPWFKNFLFRLLKGSKPVLALLRHNPFPNKPPKCIRVLFYDYEFTSFQEKAETGNWWKRTYVMEYMVPQML